MDQNPKYSTPKADRKTIEKNRRDQMKDLCCKLASLLPHQPSNSREIVSLSNQLEGAANYIKELKIRLEAMKQKKEFLMMAKSVTFSSSFSKDSTPGGLKLPRIDIHSNGAALDVVLITGLNYQFMFTETVRILQEEGADVVSASFSVLNHTVFHTIHSKIERCGLGNEAARISERLRNLVSDEN